MRDIFLPNNISIDLARLFSIYSETLKETIFQDMTLLLFMKKLMCKYFVNIHETKFKVWTIF
jgi:hypothetical protein